MTTETMLVLSTAHIKPETALILDDGRGRVIAYAKDGYGWFIPIIPGLDNAKEWPKDLYAIREVALDKECSWIMLDCDADINSELPIYDW